uniref:TonB-dependent receptor plug domain-containing protein n=1 Tax=Sphingomonas sp. TaxID=28214 RepID=UPI0035BC8F27
MGRNRVSLLTLAIVLMSAVPAAAQVAPDDSAQDQAANASQQQGVPQQTNTEARPQELQEDAAAAQGDIVVTAQRTSSLASKTPIALSAIDGDALRSQGVTNPTRLEEQVPNLSIVRNQGLQITIRGVSSSDNSEKGDPSAAFLLDGVYLARPQAQEVSFFDVARVEVLRGPQGTLYGRNTTAGLINVITNRPASEFQAAGNLIYGNYDTVQGDAMINLPISDLLAL